MSQNGDARSLLFSLASAEPKHASADQQFQKVAQAVHSDGSLRLELGSASAGSNDQDGVSNDSGAGSCLALDAVSECKYPENYVDLITVYAIGLLAELQQSPNSQVCTALASAICHTASQRIISEGADAELNLDDGYVSRGALWLLNDIAAILRNEFSTRPPSRGPSVHGAMSPVSHASTAVGGPGEVYSSEMERLLECLLDVSEGGSAIADKTPFIYPTALSLCVLLSSSTFTISRPALVAEYRDNAVSIMSRRLFAGKHSATSSTSATPRTTATPIEVQLCLPVLAIMNQKSFDNSLARPLQFKLLSERTSTVETTLAMVLSLTDALSWQQEMNLHPDSSGPLNLLGHYEAPTNIASAAVRTLSLSETARLGEDLILSLLRYATLLQNGAIMMQSTQIMVQATCEALRKALEDFEREHDNHDESFYESIFVSLEGLGRIFTDATSSDQMLGQIRISQERELAADVIRAVEVVSNNPDVPMRDETHDLAERALDEWEVVYKRRDGMQDDMFMVASSEPEEPQGAAVGVAAAATSQPGAVAVAAGNGSQANDPQARKMAAFGASSNLDAASAPTTSQAPPPASVPGVTSVSNKDVADNPQARKMAAFGAGAAAGSKNHATAPGAAPSSSTETRETSKAAARGLQNKGKVAPNDFGARPESALSHSSQSKTNDKNGATGQNMMERARAKMAQDEQERLLSNQDKKDKDFYGNDLSTARGGNKTLAAAAEGHEQGQGKKMDIYANDEHSLPPAGRYGQGMAGADKNANGNNGSGVGQLAVAVAINEAEEEKFITAAEEFDPNDRVPLWKNPKFCLGMALCFLVVIAVTVGVSVAVSKRVVESSSEPVQTQRDTMGFWDQFEAVSGDVVREEGTPQFMASQYIINVDPRELSPDDPTLIQRYVMALLFTAFDGWNWKWCGGVQDLEVCKYPCWNVDLDCAVSKCEIYDTERALTSKYTGECSAARYLEDTHECDWYGVECEENANGQRVVTEVYLKSNNLNGTFVSEIGLLTSLKHLSMQDNLVRGSIPASIDQLTQLETLFMHANVMTGELPEEFYNLNATLSDLDISSNQFSGPLSESWGEFSNLSGFKIFNNTFSGELPSGVFDMSNVQVFNIRGNNFTGTISEDVGKLSKVRELNLQYNKFAGELPNALGKLTFLSEFQINNNAFVGALPEGLFDSISIQYLYLHNNFFSGTLSESVGKLKMLEKMVLNNNAFTGPLPAALGDLDRLSILWVHFNQFEGQMPESVCTRRLTMEEPSSLYADCFGANAAVSCEGTCCTHCCHNEIYYCFET